MRDGTKHGRNQAAPAHWRASKVAGVVFYPLFSNEPVADTQLSSSGAEVSERDEDENVMQQRSRKSADERHSDMDGSLNFDDILRARSRGIQVPSRTESWPSMQK